MHVQSVVLRIECVMLCTECYVTYRVCYVMYRVLCYVQSGVLCTKWCVMYRVACYFIDKLNIRMVVRNYNYHFAEDPIIKN